MLTRLAEAFARLPDAVRRAIRGGVQTFVGTFLLTFAGSVVDQQTLLLPAATYVRLVDLAAVAAVGALVAGYAQNRAEDNGRIPALGKLPTPAPGVDDPAVEERPPA